jgi:D-serine deaminase-like pyridoxal phosphate-dependent protein
MGRAVRAVAFAATVGIEAERPLPVQIVGRDRHVPRVGAFGRPRPPKQVATDPAFVRDQLDAEIVAEVAQHMRRFHPPRGRNQEIALGRLGKFVGVPVALGRRAGFGGRGHASAIVPRVKVAELPTPALVVDGTALAHNLDTMTAALPGAQLRPHVKAHKCTALAKEQAARGHNNFTCATPREIVGMAAAGLGADLLLANESVDPRRLEAMAESGARVTVAVDSEATIAAAAAAGLREVLVDVNVGMPRCGCAPEDAEAIADLARARGLDVRGVMGYEGHVVGLADRAERVAKTADAMAQLASAHHTVGGDVVSAGGTGTYDINEVATEIQAGSYALMDTAYGTLDLPFRPALRVVATVIHVAPKYAVADCGLKALGMDHGNPTVEGGAVWFCSDEHITFAPVQPVTVGDRILVHPAHVDPTIAYHERVHIADGEALDASVIDAWGIDLRGW